MLHELLLALSGHTGGIFVEATNKAIQVVGDVPFLHPTEAAVCNRLCVLGTYYKKFQDFIQDNKHNPRLTKTSSDRSGGTTGLYLRSLCAGLDKVLDPYRETLLKLEKDILADPHLPASHLQCELEEYHLLFPGLYNVIDQIKSHACHGCHILEVLHKNAGSGIPVVKQAVLKIIHGCHQLLFKQLSAWLLHGLLMDQYNEFFIHRVKGQLHGDQPSVEEDDLGLGGVTGRQLKQIMMMSDVVTDVTPTHYQQFAVRPEMLPSYIPTRVADKILFVGESVQMFEHDKKPSVIQTGSVLKDNEDNFAKQIRILSQQEEFSLLDFEKVIDEIRTCVAKHLWTLIVEDSDLSGHLKIIKDFYLLGRGELILTFIDQASSLLKVPPSGTTQHDINMAFQQAGRNVLLDDEMVQRFTLTVDVKATSKDKKNKDSSLEESQVTESGWNSLGMSYTVEWPLHVLFTQTCLGKYNTIFKFLVSIRKVQLELHHVWALQMERKHIQRHNVHSDDKWHLRTHMAFLIDNLQYYLQVDVIESQFSVLMEAVHETRDFETVRYAHDQFLTSLLAQSFLLMKPVYHCLTEILSTCHSFCSLIMNASVSMTEGEVENMESITKNFQRQSNLLFKILSSVRSHQSSPHLAQLLLRIDYNRYFSKAGGQLGSFNSVASGDQ